MLLTNLVLNMNKEYIYNLLEAGKRVDGRKKLNEFRKIIIEKDVSKNAEGSARILLGETEVIAGVKLNILAPFPDSPDRGFIIINTEFVPIASRDFEPGPPGPEAIEISRIVDKGLRESGCIDFKSLCIKKGEKVWGIFIDIYPINHCGNLVDASTLAAIAALNNTYFPKVEEDTVVYGEKTSKKLKIAKTPVSCTFCKIKNHLILDPTLEEEKASDCRMTIIVSGEDINGIQKSGPDTLTEEEINKLIEETLKKEKVLSEKIKGE